MFVIFKVLQFHYFLYYMLPVKGKIYKIHAWGEFAQIHYLLHTATVAATDALGIDGSAINVLYGYF